MSDARASASTGASVTVDRPGAIETISRHIGKIDWQVVRDGEVVQSGTAFNSITNQGVAYMLNRAFFSSTEQPAFAVNTESSDGTGWYLGLIDSTPTLANADTPNSHAGWSELTAVYDQTSKPEFTSSSYLTAELETRESVGISSSRQLVNSVAVPITITGGSPTAVGGVFLVNVSNATYTAATTILFSTALFGTEPSVQSGDTLQVTYTHTIT